MRYIRYKIQKQQINFPNVNNEWVDTFKTRNTEFLDVCSGNCECNSTNGSGSTIRTTVKGKGSNSSVLRNGDVSKNFFKLFVDGSSASTSTTSYTFNDTESHKVYYFGVQDIEQFFKNSDIVECVISDGIISIEYGAFQNCTSLSSITIPSSVTSIGNYAFNGCTSMTSIELPSNISIIGDGTFGNCSALKSFIIPSSVKSIVGGAFQNCTSLESIVFPNGLETIGNQVFYNCNRLTSIDIPSSVTSIANGTFESCSGLTSVTIGSGVTSIGYNAFKGCRRLIEITCYATTAPTIEESTFDNLPTNVTLHVPQGSDYSSWLRSGWEVEYII